MTDSKLKTYRNRLLKLAARLRGDLESLEDDVRSTSGADAAGNLSNAPMHLGDLGTAEEMHEIDTTLYENEEAIHADVAAALDRIDAGTFGSCSRCGRSIPAARLDALPYTPYCVSCAEEVQAGHPTNLDAGRPAGGLDTADARRAHESAPEGVIPGDDPADFAETMSDTTASAHSDDVHAAGTAGGGSASGGLAGTNTGSGDPSNADLDAAMGSGNYDQEIEADFGDTDAKRPRVGRPSARATRKGK
ncbi:TraR/DksA C4-type zinc finger protein [Tautonia sp. JC769]|uniref:TraR/DksA family transcriptional regulator n=1 Tax=Tautonia sp. JC769 TaxID=3232135 RepID=UPI0034598969